MIPSLVVTEIRDALVEYLASTFALSDDDVREALTEFLTHNADGIFRGPYLRVRTPFRTAPPGWISPLAWLPPGFHPYAHQAAAFDRLSTSGGRDPKPTLVTTGTGSGKTECFLFPILDHCARERAYGNDGIKALILYPMNALASDQAGRIAELIHTHSALAGVRAGLYIGGEGRHAEMGADHLIDRREALRANPPDILLTNYKMLDYLLLRREDHDLWATNGPTTLRYVVLDELHTYDGAQGTDVAMLLRRLGRTLGMATAERPLGVATPVATSATLGTGPTASADLREFARKVFGIEFDEESIIGESRLSPEESVDDTDFFLPIPEIEAVDEAGDDLEAIVATFCRREDADAPHTIPDPTDPVALGRVLLQHPLTRAVLAAVGERPRTWEDALAEIVTRAPNWGRAARLDPEGVHRALGRFLWLLSLARRSEGDRLRPLFSIEVHLWVREVSRLLRSVEHAPLFRWRDSAEVERDDRHRAGHELPAVYCRRCGMSGWMALQSEVADTLNTNPTTIYAAAIERRPTVRVLLRCHPDDPNARAYDPDRRRFAPGHDEQTVAVLVTPDEDAARANKCPGCDERDAIRFVGLQVASLASVSINTLFASPHVEEEERKLLAFTDSVQDASHRASFFAGRTHRINLRTVMSRIVQAHGAIRLADLGDALFEEPENPRDRFGLVPPDLARHRLVRTTWTDDPDPRGLDILRSRLGFEADIEFGLRSRVGRTLELSFAAAATVDIPDLDAIVALLTEDLRHVFGSVPDGVIEHLDVYLRGLVERLRLQGGLVHPLLEPYLLEDGSQWRIWGGRPDGLPPFTPGQGRPTFYTTSTSGDFSSLTQQTATPTWLVDWAMRSLGLDPSGARTINSRALPLLASESEVVVQRDTQRGHRVFGLNRGHVVVHDLPDESRSGGVRCVHCGARHPTPHDAVDNWVGTPCLRYRCTGTYEPDPVPAARYYRNLYRRGITRRVVTDEHTGLLTRERRERLEAAFKDGIEPDAPNVLTATPTLEMGIDIGDLSAVLLTSVPPRPANYVQRTGRAGRSTGNSLITTFVRTDTHGLYYLAEPDAMIAGEVRPPNCYLDAAEILQRQYVAYLLDRMADRTVDAPPIPNQMGALMNRGLDEGGFLRRLIDTSQLDPSHVDGFLALFGDQLESASIEGLREFAATGIEARVKAAHEQWQQQVAELSRRARRVATAIERTSERAASDPEAEDDLSTLRGQRAAVLRQLRELRTESALNGLVRLGLLPNYTLVEDATTLVATTWSRNEDGEYETEINEYPRSGNLAVTELAPGNSFYAGGHRHYIDALEIGPADQPQYEQWRLCPECGYGSLEVDVPPSYCPRCGSAAIADMGALHTMLRLRTSLAASSEEAARVYDDEDDRVRERYDVIVTVDVDPSYVEGAWALPDRGFGAELCGVTHLRTINLGFREQRGERRAVAGADRHLTRFTVCRSCGAVREARVRVARNRPERLHQGWCRHRSGGGREDQILLYHELTTEAVRLLLPVSMFEVEERLASFKGALLLGVRAEFGGDPDHLQVVRSDMPNRSGLGRRQFLVLYDRVPGGTGYLSRLADPERVRRMLLAAREIISTCPCRTEGRAACHRCLLGVVDRPEYDLARRDLALEILDQLLEEWAPEPVDSVAGIDIGLVEESELERRFKVALRDWAEHADFEHVSLRPIAGSGSFDAFELRIVDKGQTGEEKRAVRWHIEEQRDLDTNPRTRPDFLLRRMDDRGPEVAIYLDGYQFHATEQGYRLDDDATKRAAVRATGRLVWNLTWEDVEHFHKAMTAEIRHDPPPRPLLTGAARATAQQAHLRRGSWFDADVMHGNPMALLLDYLAHPVAKDWEDLALSACAGAAKAGGVTPIDSAQLLSVLTSAVEGAEPPAGRADTAVAHLATFATAAGLRLVLVLDAQDPNAERWTVLAILPDGPEALREPEHKARWHDWHQWANLLQFLRGDGRDAVISTTSLAALNIEALDELWLAARVDQADAAPSVMVPAPAAAGISVEMEEELDLVEDDAVRGLVRAVLERGGPAFVAGHELPNGEVVEAAWEDTRVGVTPPGSGVPSSAGWDIRPADVWTIDELIERIGVVN